jgi:hypothetical protein
MSELISTASGSERASRSGTARGTDPASLPVYAIAIRSRKTVAARTDRAATLKGIH